MIPGTRRCTVSLSRPDRACVGVRSFPRLKTFTFTIFCGEILGLTPARNDGDAGVMRNFLTAREYGRTKKDEGSKISIFDVRVAPERHLEQTRFHPRRVHTFHVRR